MSLTPLVHPCSLLSTLVHSLFYRLFAPSINTLFILLSFYPTFVHPLLTLLYPLLNLCSLSVHPQNLNIICSVVYPLIAICSVFSLSESMHSTLIPYVLSSFSPFVQHSERVLLGGHHHDNSGLWRHLSNNRQVRRQ
jgi:hypothetical protein